MWNFCTLKHETLVKFTFDLYDSDGSGELSEKEVFNMVRLMRPSARADEAEKQTKKMMALMDRDDADGLTKDNLISFDEFMVAHRKMGSVIFPGERAKLMATCTTELTCMRLASPRLASPRFASLGAAFQLQRQIRLKSMSKKFWASATDKRERLFGEDSTDLIKMYIDFCKEKEIYSGPDGDDEQDEFDKQAEVDKEREKLEAEQMLESLNKQKFTKQQEREEVSERSCKICLCGSV